jgi:hypothetical protein
MIKRTCRLSLLGALFCAGATDAQQYPILDKVADKVIQKYQTATCEQLWQEKSAKPAPKPQMEQQAIQFLKNDAQIRQVFLNKVAPPIANKMFECGMIP